MRVPQRHRRLRAAQRQVGAAHLVALLGIGGRRGGLGHSDAAQWREPRQFTSRRSRSAQAGRSNSSTSLASPMPRRPARPASSTKPAHRQPPARARPRRLRRRRHAAIPCGPDPSVAVTASPANGRVARNVACWRIASDPSRHPAGRGRPACAPRIGIEELLCVVRLRIEPVRLDPDLQEMHRRRCSSRCIRCARCRGRRSSTALRRRGSRRRCRSRLWTCCPRAPARRQHHADDFHVGVAMRAETAAGATVSSLIYRNGPKPIHAGSW